MMWKEYEDVAYFRRKLTKQIGLALVWYGKMLMITNKNYNKNTFLLFLSEQLFLPGLVGSLKMVFSVFGKFFAYFALFFSILGHVPIMFA